jgi:hypothetical protein
LPVLVVVFVEIIMAPHIGAGGSGVNGFCGL